MPRGIHHRAGQEAHGIVGGDGLHGFELCALRVEMLAPAARRDGSSGRGHHHGFRSRGQMQLDGDDIGMSGDVFGVQERNPEPGLWIW